MKTLTRLLPLGAALALAWQTPALAQTTQPVQPAEPAQKPLLTPIDPAAGQPRKPSPAAVAEAQLPARLAGLDARLARLERVFENQVMRELLQSIDALQAEVRELRGEIENQYNELEIVQKRQRDLYRDSDRRLRELELGVTARGGTAGVASGLPEAPQPAAPAQPAAGTAVTGTSTTASTTPPAPVNEEDEKAAYVSAFEFLKTGQYAEAINAYKGFLEKYPSGRYADNAQYWMGEANYVSRKFEDALNQFRVVVNDFPSSPKVADARLKIGFALYEMQRWDDARGELESVIRDYPNSSVARLARQRLVRMKKEGH